MSHLGHCTFYSLNSFFLQYFLNCIVKSVLLFGPLLQDPVTDVLVFLCPTSLTFCPPFSSLPSKSVPCVRPLFCSAASNMACFYDAFIFKCDQPHRRGSAVTRGWQHGSGRLRGCSSAGFTHPLLHNMAHVYPWGN